MFLPCDLHCFVLYNIDARHCPLLWLLMKNKKQCTLLWIFIPLVFKRAAFFSSPWCGGVHRIEHTFLFKSRLSPWFTADESMKTITDLSGCLCFYEARIWKISVNVNITWTEFVWCLHRPEFNLQILFYSQVQNFSPTNTFIYNCEDFGEWGRWEREARIMLTTGNVLFLWNQISHSAVCYC